MTSASAAPMSAAEAALDMTPAVEAALEATAARTVDTPARTGKANQDSISIMAGSDLPYGSYAFVDERGEPNLEVTLPGASHYFILAAVIVDGAALENVRADAEEIRRRFFQTGPMKSAGVSDNARRRLDVLKAVATIGIRAHILIVEKEALSKSGGLLFRQSFVKFFHRQIYDQLFYTHTGMKIVAEPFGKAAFQVSFKAYVERRTALDLFRRSAFEWGDKADPLLQVADMICGSFGTALEPDKKSVTVEQVRDALGAIPITYEWWPPYKFHDLSRSTGDTVSSHDHRVRTFCARLAIAFLERESDQSPEGRCQVAAVKILLQLQQVTSGTTSIHKDALAEQVRTMVPEIEMPAGRWFQRYVIAALRDEGVIITSTTQGYKIPTSVADVKAYGRDVRGRVEPMLTRLKSARTQLKLMTGGELDILSDPEFDLLRALIEKVELPTSPDET
jgi:hypothetical protein